MSSKSGFAWKSVDVSLPDPGTDVNHYDNASPAAVGASKDLEAQQFESCGMFFGLQVLDGSMYELIHNRMVIKTEAHKQTFIEDSQTKLSKNKNKKELGGGEQISDGDSSKIDARNKPKTPENTSKKRKKEGDKDDDSPPFDSEVGHDVEAGDEATSRRKKKRKKKKRKNDEPEFKEQHDLQVHVLDVDPFRVSALHDSWVAATGGVALNNKICEGLLKQGFQIPTPIQAATLPASILGRRNIVGAAATGSGKTLAYLIPILQYLQEHTLEGSLPIQALILAPTRELALQVADECEKLIPKTTATIVGGLAPHKQARILDTRKPPIVIGTPGRLWQLMSSRQHEHLNNLTQLRYLVIDEADRMIQQGSFPQLERILEAVHIANPLDDNDEDMDQDMDSENQQSDRLLSLPGVKGESHVTMLGDILQQMESRKEESRSDVNEIEQLIEEENEATDKFENDNDVSALELPSAPPVYRQTFVFSATLTLPANESYLKAKRRNKKVKTKGSSLTGAIAEILERAHTYGKTKVVDLTSSTKLVAKDNEVVVVKGELTTSKSRLPPGLTLQTISCTQKHKDSHLYAYLVTTAQGAAGPCLVFCNSIAGAKRVGVTLQTLRLPVRMLHASMPQKARFKAMESLQSGSSRAIVVCTDVAARGLDIPNVATVIHYDVARGVNTFIHRAGRTARGMGENAVGSSVSLISSAEERQQKAITDELGKHLFSTVQLDGRLLAEAQERVNLASKIVTCDDIESRSERSNTWFKDAAVAADLELDDDILDEGLAGGNLKDQQRLREAKKARSLLRSLLAQPMVTQRFGKFLSSYSAVTNPPVAQHFAPLEAKSGKKRKK